MFSRRSSPHRWAWTYRRSRGCTDWSTARSPIAPVSSPRSPTRSPHRYRDLMRHLSRRWIDVRRRRAPPVDAKVWSVHLEKHVSEGLLHVAAAAAWPVEKEVHLRQVLGIDVSGLLRGLGFGEDLRIL